MKRFFTHTEMIEREEMDADLNNAMLKHIADDIHPGKDLYPGVRIIKYKIFKNMHYFLTIDTSGIFHVLCIGGMTGHTTDSKTFFNLSNAINEYIEISSIII